MANRQRAIAQQRFSEVRQLAHTFVFDVYDEVARLQGSTKTRDPLKADKLKPKAGKTGDFYTLGDTKIDVTRL